ncbi:hypothetical protein [Nocardia blacklockiae]|uniref:hypothetical protein n=1 Tax=Nocardia blacklockiae TaxID=480036 RepID=UPI0018959222|nr:hypothetical protein [Nocardia blacklockiae]MBF6171008.1 hypothetical protein [Nocardia blacklockiae]
MHSVRTTAAALRFSVPTTLRAHTQSGFAARDFRLCRAWLATAAPLPDRVLLSVNEFRPHRRTALFPVALVSAELEQQVVRTNGALGIVTGYQPHGGITFSLSLWAGEQPLEEFTGSPEHVAVMDAYRTRGYLRHIHWWGTHRSIGASLAEARRRLDAGQGRRVGEPRDPWARRDHQRLAAAGPAQ